MIADILWPIIGFMATAFAVSSTIPQMKKALKTKKSDDISIRFILVLIIVKLLKIKNFNTLISILNIKSENIFF